MELSIEVTIINELGLHARAASKIAEIVKNAQSKLWISKDGLKVDASSIIDILTLEGTMGSKITLSADSESDTDILNEIRHMIETGFGES